LHVNFPPAFTVPLGNPFYVLEVPWPLKPLKATGARKKRKLAGADKAPETVAGGIPLWGSA